LAVNRSHGNFGAYGLWVRYPESYTANVSLNSLWSLIGWLLMVQWLMGGCKVCADTSCVVDYTMGGCVSCEFTRWCHGSRCTTWRELWFAYIYDNTHVEVLLLVIDFELERRVVWIERLILVNIPSIVNCLTVDCVRVALKHRERVRSSEIDSEVTHLRERLSDIAKSRHLRDRDCCTRCDWVDLG